MGTRKIKDAELNGEKVYFASHAKATYMSDGRNVETAMQGKEFSFTFLQDSQVVTIDAYAGESSYESYSYALGDKIYTNYEIHVIEK